MHDDDLKQARRILDDEADRLNADTRQALNRARHQALATPAPRRAPVWALGSGLATAAAVATMLWLPGEHDPATPTASEDWMLIAEAGDLEMADEDLAFLLWLEENHDAG